MWIVIAFIAFIALASVAGIIAGAINSKAKLELIRAAIEKGQTLDAALIDKLTANPQQEQSPSPAQTGAGLRVGGVMCFAAGVGLPVLGIFVSKIDSRWLPAMLGVGGFLICIGIGLFVASKVVLMKGAGQGA